MPLNANVNTVAPQSNVQFVTRPPIDIMVENEYNRINKKKQSIDEEYDTQKRLLAFNNSFGERYSYYISMMYVVIIALVIFIGLSILGSVFLIPSIIIDTLAVILICVTGAILFSYYNVIRNRNNINFQELDLSPPTDISKSNDLSQKLGIDKMDLVNSKVDISCTNGECCDVGTRWDNDKKKCEKVVDPFTTVEMTENFEVMPNSAYEFSNYSNY